MTDRQLRQYMTLGAMAQAGRATAGQLARLERLHIRLKYLERRWRGDLKLEAAGCL